jgi:hypothetical protein
MHHPVLRLRPHVEEGVAAANPAAVQPDDDLARLPRLAGVGALIPDLHAPRAVVALGDGPVEGQVFERVILGVDGLAVLRRIVRKAVREREAREDAVVLEPQVEMPAPRGMLVHDEPVTRRFGCDAGSGSGVLSRRRFRSYSRRRACFVGMVPRYPAHGVLGASRGWTCVSLVVAIGRVVAEGRAEMTQIV